MGDAVRGMSLLIPYLSRLSVSLRHPLVAVTLPSTIYIRDKSTSSSLGQIVSIQFLVERKADSAIDGRNTSTAFALSSGTLGAALGAVLAVPIPGPSSQPSLHIDHIPAIALSYGVVKRPVDPNTIDLAHDGALDVCERLWNDWGNEDDEGHRVQVYSVNVPLVPDVLEKAKRKVVWTRMRRNAYGPLFQTTKSSVLRRIRDGHAHHLIEIPRLTGGQTLLSQISHPIPRLSNLLSNPLSRLSNPLKHRMMSRLILIHPLARRLPLQGQHPSRLHHELIHRYPLISRPLPLPGQVPCPALIQLLRPRSFRRQVNNSDFTFHRQCSLCCFHQRTAYLRARMRGRSQKDTSASRR